MGKPKAPAPVDPIEAGRAQTATNVATALANNISSANNYITPEGTQTTTQSGTYKWTDPVTGDVYDLPRFTTTTAYTGINKDLYDSSQQAKLGLSNFANDQIERMSTLMSAPFNLDFLPEYNDGPLDLEAIENRLVDLGRLRLDPLVAENRTTLENRLADQGIMRGSAAYDRAMETLGKQENDAYNQLFLTGHTTAFNEEMQEYGRDMSNRQQMVLEALLERNQPINEISSLLGGSQMSLPNFPSMPTTPIPTTDYAGLMYDSKAQEMANYQQKLAMQQSLMGGLFGLGGKMIGAGWFG